MKHFTLIFAMLSFVAGSLIAGSPRRAIMSWLCTTHKGKKSKR